MAFDAEAVASQKALNSSDRDSFYDGAMSFASCIMPLLGRLRKRIPALQDTHFSLMLDDAHDLNPWQVKTVNSWIAYRDN